ncbi:MAG: ParB/RepB/Spo0J family partition protein [Rhizobiaceae bacterium]
MSRSKKTKQISLSASRDIPLDRLMLSQANVRNVKAGISIEELAADIARRTLLASLTVRPVLDDEGNETGRFEVPAGGRRFRALELLVKQKRLAKDALIPCIVRTEGLAEEDSLAENIQRAPLHALDQFRAFLSMREKGMREEEIAAAFFVSANIVRQRLRLASVSPKLLDIYADDEMNLDQLMAFAVTADHQRQEQVWEQLGSSWPREPYRIRRMLMEGAVKATERRARFVGIEEYEAAGGIVLRDLFQSDEGGWLQDAALLDRLVTEKLERGANLVREEGWKWVEAAIDFPYGHSFGLRRISGEVDTLSDEEAAELEALRQEAARLEEEHTDAEEFSEEADRRMGEIETRIEELENRPVRFAEDQKSTSGAFVSIDGAGCLRVERGFVRPEDEERPETAEADAEGKAGGTDRGLDSDPDAVDTPVNASSGADNSGDEEDDAVRPLPERLVTELTAHRTIALRDALASDPHIAFIAALHAVALRLFYIYAQESCVEIEPKSIAVGSHAPGLADTQPALAIAERHETWRKALPENPADLWDELVGLDADSREALFAHCVSLTINAVHETWNRRPKALAHADRLAEALLLDMTGAGWRPTLETYLGRVTKGRILEAVREACGEEAADRIAGQKKDAMAASAEELLADTGWLPVPLRTPASAESGTTDRTNATDAPSLAPETLDEVESEASRDETDHPIAAE